MLLSFEMTCMRCSFLYLFFRKKLLPTFLWMQGWHELHSNSITEKFYPLLKNPWTYLCHSGNLQNWDEFECQWLVIQFHDDSCLLIRKLQSILQSHSLPELICCNFKFSNVVSGKPFSCFQNFQEFFTIFYQSI